MSNDIATINPGAKCDGCPALKKLRYEHGQYGGPENFIEVRGRDPGSMKEKYPDIWIVGINPKVISSSDSGGGPMIHPYFEVFRKVSETLGRLIDEGKVAHTDIVKCSSKKWPELGVNPSGTVSHCFDNYLFNQIETHKPKIIICNGAPVSRAILERFGNRCQYLDDEDKNGVVSIDLGKGIRSVVVLSGYMGRLDQYSLRRIGLLVDKEIGKIRF